MNKLNFFATVNPSIALKFIKNFKECRHLGNEVQVNVVVATFKEDRGVAETVVEEGFDWADTAEGYAYWQRISEQWKDLVALRTKIRKKEEEIAELKESYNSSLGSFDRL